MSAPWDRRPTAEHIRVERLTLGRWLPTVVAATAHWQERATGAGLEAKDLDDRDALRLLAPSRGLELARAGGPGGPALVLRPDENQVKAYADGEMLKGMVAAIRRDPELGRRWTMLHEFRPVQVHRAGPLGRLNVVSSRSDLDRMHRTGARAAAVLGLAEHDTVLNAVPMSPTVDFYGIYHLALGASVLAAHPRGGGGGVAALVDAARSLMPTVVVVRDIDAPAVATTLHEAAVDLSRVRLIVQLGPPPDDATRAELAGAFAAAGAGDGNPPAVLALWGPPESRALWAECAPGAGLHTYPDLEVLEIVDPLTGRPTDRDGDLTLTTMGWHGTVLLRFQTGAWVDPLATEPCPGCGRTVPRIVGDLAPGAWELDFAVDETSVAALDLRGVPAVLSSLEQVTAWRVVVEGPDGRRPGDRLTVEIAGELGRDDRHWLTSELTAACGVAPELVVGVHPDEIAWAIEQAGGPFADLR